MSKTWRCVCGESTCLDSWIVSDLYPRSLSVCNPVLFYSHCISTHASWCTRSSLFSVYVFHSVRFLGTDWESLQAIHSSSVQLFVVCTPLLICDCPNAAKVLCKTSLPQWVVLLSVTLRRHILMFNQWAKALSAQPSWYVIRVVAGCQKHLWMWFFRCH